MLTIKYLLGASSITFFETTGIDGLMHEGKFFPVFEWLKILRSHRPKFIKETASNKPLQVDALVIENEAGEEVGFLINFTNETLGVKLEWKDNSIHLSPASINITQ